MINLNQLRAFYSVVKTGTFSKAAAELFVTEPAVFIQVRSLERCLGFKLLDKLGKDLTPTETGRLLYGYAEKIFNLVDEAEAAIKDVRDLKKGDLRVGTANALAQYLMPIIISSFQDNHPKIQVHLDEASSSELVRGVLAHNYEVAIVARVSYPETVEYIPLSTEEIVLVVSPRSKLAARERCSLSELNGNPMICRDIRSATRQAIWSEFEKKRIKPSAIIEAGNTEFIKNLVGKNKGVSFLARICVGKEVERGELVIVPFEEGPFFLPIDAIHLKGKTLSSAAITFLHFLKQTSKDPNLGSFVDRMTGKKEIFEDRGTSRAP
ncbi:MAG TPA: LysR family transcriptional regulator [Syntrophorhabdaceae bacterium]|jgi:DNA-binding transcriptional LysR family regulator